MPDDIHMRISTKRPRRHRSQALPGGARSFEKPRSSVRTRPLP